MSLPISSWKSRPAAVILMAVLALALTGCGTAGDLISGPTLTPPAPGGTPIDPPIPLPAFTLIDQHGATLTEEDLLGKPSLLYFGYTFCPDVCPLTLAEMAQVADLLEQDASRVNLVFVSVDFRRDTPRRLNEYLPAFNAGFIGLTTDEEAHLQALTGPLGIFYELEPEAETQAEYLVAHTASTFMADAEGLVRTKFAYRTPPEVIAEALRDELAAAPEDASTG